MKPTEIWTRKYKLRSFYRPSPQCFPRSLEEELKAKESAINFRDSEDSIAVDIKKLKDYVPLGEEG